MTKSIMPLVCARCGGEFLPQEGGKCRKCDRLLCHGCLPRGGEFCIDCGGKKRWYRALGDSPVLGLGRAGTPRKRQKDSKKSEGAEKGDGQRPQDGGTNSLMGSDRH
jgi:hypothetical protein